MSQYLKSTWVRVGLVLLVVGATPLLFIITAAALGLWPDPNPNPVGPGILFGLTFWPAIYLHRGRRDTRPSAPCGLTIVGGGREAWSVWLRGRCGRLCARGAHPACSSGPS